MNRDLRSLGKGVSGKLKRKVLFAVLFFVFSSSVFSQNFSRILEVKTPRMNGEDVRSLQKQLINLKFYQVGEADGYYGPLTEKAIKDIQSFSGFLSNGIVNKDIWNFIFDKKKEPFILNISTILTYNPTKLKKSTNLLYSELMEIAERGGDLGGEAFIYSSSDGKPKIMEYHTASPNYQVDITCYFIYDSYYFAKYKATSSYYDDEYNTMIKDSYGTEYFLVNEKNIFEIKNGNQKRIKDNNSILETVTDMLRIFYH